MRRRTSVSGDFSSRNRRTCRRSSSCSSLKPKFIAASILRAAPAGATTPVSYQTAGLHDQPRGLAYTVGMQGVERIWEDAAVEVHRLVVGPIANNVYVVRCRRTGDALLIDAANEHERLLEVCRDARRPHRWSRPTATGTTWPRSRRCATRATRSRCAREDAGMLESYDLLLEDDDVLEVGRLRVRTVHTPGHTPGSICFAVEGTPLFFSGDTLFPGGPGNTKTDLGDFSIDHRGRSTTGSTRRTPTRPSCCPATAR